MHLIILCAEIDSPAEIMLRAAREALRTDSERIREISSEWLKLIFEVKNDLRICEKLKIIPEPSEPFLCSYALNYSTTSWLL